MHGSLASYPPGSTISLLSFTDPLMLSIPLGPPKFNLAFDPQSQFLLIAGPCVIESEDLCLSIAGRVKETVEKLGASRVMPYVFKASFDKANRSSANSKRGVEIETGLEILAHVRDQDRKS